jgi:hypothetical protein
VKGHKENLGLKEKVELKRTRVKYKQYIPRMKAVQEGRSITLTVNTALASRLVWTQE